MHPAPMTGAMPADAGAARAADGIREERREPSPPPAAAPSTSPSGAEPLASGGRFYRVVWRWHFYAGLIVAPVVLLASLTGATLVFENELKQWLYPARHVAASAGEVRLPLRAQVAAARAAAEASPAAAGGPLRLHGVRIGDWPRSTTIGMHRGDAETQRRHGRPELVCRSASRGWIV